MARIGALAAHLPGQANVALDFTGRYAVALPRATATPNSVDWSSLPRLIQDIGADALPVTCAANLLVGIIVGFLGVSQLGRFGAVDYVPELVVVAHLRDLCPLITAMVVAGRSGAGIASEIATMTVFEEVDALRSMGFDPVRWLVVPRCIALVLVLPLLTWVGDLMGLLGGLVAATLMTDITVHAYVQATLNAITGGHFLTGLIKTPFLGLAIGLIACGQGLLARGGAAAVGTRTTKAVVLATFSVIVISRVHILCRTHRYLSMSLSRPYITVDDLRIGWGTRVLMDHISFRVERGTIFAILGGSGSGKSTLLRHLIGLERAQAGRIDIDGVGEPYGYEGVPPFGVLFQSGALFSSLTLAENLALPLTRWTQTSGATARDLVLAKLDLVGLGPFADHLPGEVSGGMRKRAGIARALMLEADLLFFDEPSAGLDPVSAVELDQLILTLCRDLGITVVIVTHELPSIFLVADNCIVLDTAAKGVVAEGNPHKLRDESKIPFVHNFFTRSAPGASTHKGG
jgi:ABC transport permease subunit